MKKQAFLAIALQCIFSWVLPAQSTILFQTTATPAGGDLNGQNISSTIYVGNYFVLNSPSHVDGIGVEASTLDGNSTIFGAIIAVPNLSALPTGTPFGASGTAAPLVTALLRPSTTNAIITAPVSADLPAGTYIVVFGTGQFGATATSANLAFSSGGKSSLPVGANQVTYGPQCNSGTTPCWSSSGISSPYYFQVTGSNGLSSITSLNPNSVLPGGSAFQLTVNGNNFLATSTVSFNGTSLPTTYVNASQLTASVPANLILQAGTAQVTVTTNSQISSNFPFTIGASNGPTLTSLSPSGIQPGSNGFTITVNGSGFQLGAIVLWNGAFLITNFNSSSQLTATVTPGLVANAGIAGVTVQNPGSGGISNALNFTIGTVINVPTVTSLSPTSALVGGQTFTLTVNGSNFNSNSAVLWNSSILPTTLVNAGQLTATVNATLIAGATTANISVTNSGAGTSGTISFPVTAVSGAQITSLSPATAVPGGASFTLTINGSNFNSNSAVLWNGNLLPTTVVSTTQITATVNSSLIGSSGSANVTVNNPGTGSSNVAVFTISVTPPPVLSSLSPSSAAPGGAAFTLTVTGSNFTQTSAILWNNALQATTYVSPTQLTASIGAPLIATAGTATVTVNTTNAGSSNGLPFSIATQTGPTITTLSPTSVLPGAGSFVLTVTGSGFTNSSTVQWGSTALVTVYVSPTQLQASVSNVLVASAGSANVTVTTGSATSNASVFTIGTPNTPVLSSLSPNTATVGGAAFTLTVNGSNFASGAAVNWGGTLLPTTFGSATQVTANVPASLIATAGTANVTVTNPTGTSSTSNALTFTISNTASPTISTLSPPTASAGAAAFTLTVNGQGFLSGAAIRWNGAALANTTFVNSTQLTGSIPASLLASAGTATVSVANPGNSISNSLIFTITGSSTSTTIFQTTQAPAPGLPGQAALSNGQFLGNYFVLTQTTHIDSIGTYAQASDGGTIFGAIISVPSLTSAPSGNPFDGTTLATATLRPGATTSIVTAPVSVDLPAGTYVLVFGSGYYGATSTQAFAAATGLPSAVPTGWNQVSWGLYCSNVNVPCWGANFASPSQFYFVATGSTQTAPSLSITNLNPSAATAGGGQFTLTVNGTGFVNGSTVEWNGATLTTTFVSATQLTAQVPVGLITFTGAASVTVLNPGGGAISNAVTFTISSPTVSISSLNPPSAVVGGQAYTLNVTGTGFTPNATVQWNGSALSTTYTDPTHVSATVPANLIATQGTASVSVLSAGGIFSNTITYSIGPATPVISSLSPNSVTVGSPQTTVTITGTGFLFGSQALFNSTPVVTNYVNATQVTAIVPPTLLASVATFNVTVQNPSSVVSNASPFSVAPIGGGSASAGLAHFAVGANYTTGISIVNTGGTNAVYSISFFADNGTSIVLPFSTGSTNRLSGTLPPYGSLYVEASNPGGVLTSGWAQIAADSPIVVQSLFRSTIGQTYWEAAVESSTGSKAFEFPFDLTNFSAGTPLYTGVAIANLDGANAANVSCTARDRLGNVIAGGVSIPTIPPFGHWAGASFPNLASLAGTLDCVSNTNVAVVALRFIGAGSTFSSLPVIKK